MARKLPRQIKGGLLNEQAAGLLNGFFHVIRAFRSESMGLGRAGYYETREIARKLQLQINRQGLKAVGLTLSRYFASFVV
jgi:hypothetical protein